MEEESKREEVQQESEGDQDKPIGEMTVKELKEVAQGIEGLTGFSSMKKDELLEAIKKAEKGEGEAEPEGEAEGAPTEGPGAEIPDKPLDKLTAKELREIAREIPGVTGVHAMKKDQLLEIITKAKGIKEEIPPRRKKRGAAAKEVHVGELKKKIMLLKQEKEAARAARDKKKVDVLRRRINRLKKRTRKAA